MIEPSPKGKGGATQENQQRGFNKEFKVVHRNLGERSFMHIKSMCKG